MSQKSGSFAGITAGVLAGMAAGAAVTYAMSGDAVLLRKNMHKMEREARHALHEAEKKFL